MASISYPGCEVVFHLQKQQDPIVVRTASYSTSSLGNELISVQTNNDMNNDNPVFQITLNTQSTEWEKLFTVNDVVVIRMSHDYYEKDYITVMVGMIADIQKQEDYSNSIMQYVITGMGMSKLLTNISIGQLLSIGQTEWLPDDSKLGIQFTGRTSCQIITDILGKFVFDTSHTDYTFKVNGEEEPLTYFIRTNMENNTDEVLLNRTPYTTFSGTLLQFITSLAAKPFNEFFWTFSSPDNAVFNYRPTHYDPGLWKKLTRYEIDNTNIQSQQLDVNDTDQAAVFKVNIPSGVNPISSLALGVYPLTNKELIQKYGYKSLEVENPYIYSEESPSSGYGTSLASEGKSDEEIKKQYPSYETVNSYVADKHCGLKSDDAIRKSKVKATNNLYTKMQGRLGYGQCESVINTYCSKRTKYDLGYHLNYTEYQDILKNVKYTTDQGKAAGLSTGQTKLAVYTQKLFNWFADQSKYYSGNVVILGYPNINVGSVMVWYDLQAKCTWEGYITAVSHDWSIQNGYTTTLGVNRCVQIPQDYTGEQADYRFHWFWGKYTQFYGGYFGEPNLSSQQQQLEEDEGFDGNFSNESDGSAGAMSALEVANKADKKPSKYRMGAGRGSDPLTKSTIVADCSSFVWWCYHDGPGVDLKGGKSGMTTDTIAQDSTNLTTVSKSNKSAALKKMKVGDLIFFNTYKHDGHIAIYEGNGNFIGCQGSSGVAVVKNFPSKDYWWSKFSGHVMRY